MECDLNKENRNDIVLIQFQKSKQMIQQCCKRIQHQSMMIEKRKHRKQVYIEMYEFLVEYLLKATSLLEKIAVKVICDSIHVTKDDQEAQDFLQSIETPEMINNELQALIKSIDQFQYKPSQTAMHVLFEPAAQIQLGKRQHVMDKYVKLQALEKTLEELKDTNGHKEDMDALETQQIAERFFI